MIPDSIDQCSVHSMCECKIEHNWLVSTILPADFIQNQMRNIVFINSQNQFDWLKICLLQRKLTHSTAQTDR